MAEKNANQTTSSVQASSKRTRPTGTALVRSGATSASNLHLVDTS